MKAVLPAGWTVEKSSDFCLRVADGTHDTPKPADDGYPLITSKNLKEGQIKLDGAYNISTADFDAVNKRSKVDQWDVLFSMIGTVGQMALVRDRPNFAIKNIGLFKSRSRDDGMWLYYYLTSSIGQAALDTFLTGTSQQFVGLTDLRKVPVIAPSPEAKRRIAAILSAYDDLIETNKRRIALLEKMAEELYREWFVRMRFPGHQAAKFVKGVPEGWEPKSMGALIEHYIGGGWGEEDQTSGYSESAFVIRGTDIPKVQRADLSSMPFRFHTASNLKSRIMQPDDFVFEVSGGSKNQLLGRNVRVSSSLLSSLPETVIPASFCKLIRFDRQKVSPYLMQQYLKLFYEQGLVGIFQVQSTGISNYQFESFLKHHKMLTPPATLQQQFEDAVKPILDLKDQIGLENTVATQTRDLLLPRLISGKLSVEDLDIQFPPSMQEETTEPEAAHA